MDMNIVEHFRKRAEEDEYRKNDSKRTGNLRRMSYYAGSEMAFNYCWTMLLASEEMQRTGKDKGVVELNHFPIVKAKVECFTGRSSSSVLTQVALWISKQENISIIGFINHVDDDSVSISVVYEPLEID